MLSRAPAGATSTCFPEAMSATPPGEVPSSPGRPDAAAAPGPKPGGTLRRRPKSMAGGWPTPAQTARGPPRPGATSGPENRCPHRPLSALPKGHGGPHRRLADQTFVRGNLHARVAAQSAEGGWGGGEAERGASRRHLNLLPRNNASGTAKGLGGRPPQQPQAPNRGHPPAP